MPTQELPVAIAEKYAEGLLSIYNRLPIARDQLRPILQLYGMREHINDRNMATTIANLISNTLEFIAVGIARDAPFLLGGSPALHMTVTTDENRVINYEYDNADWGARGRIINGNEFSIDNMPSVPKSDAQALIMTTALILFSLAVLDQFEREDYKLGPFEFNFTIQEVRPSRFLSRSRTVTADEWRMTIVGVVHFVVTDLRPQANDDIVLNPMNSVLAASLLDEMDRASLRRGRDQRRIPCLTTHQ